MPAKPALLPVHNTRSALPDTAASTSPLPAATSTGLWVDAGAAVTGAALGTPATPSATPLKTADLVIILE
ncbi:hypothetical protein [Streptomyces fumanus]|nr:hypothetical protein [Streptomyces fumanus]